MDLLLICTWQFWIPFKRVKQKYSEECISSLITKAENDKKFGILLPSSAFYSCRALFDLLLHETIPQMTPYNLAPLNSPNQNTRISFPIIAVFIYGKKERCLGFSSGERNLRLSLAKLVSNWENRMLMIKPRRKKTHTHTEKTENS